MSEAMTSESIIEAEWILKGYWTKVRFAFQTENGGWSDVDVLAYRPEIKHLVVAESKVRGPKTHVYAYTKKWRDKYGGMNEFDDGGYFDFLRHLPTLCEDGVVFSSFTRMVKRITVQLVCNYIVNQEIQEVTKKEVLRDKGVRKLPARMDLKLDTTIDVLGRIIQLERKSGKGRRYGNPILDVARELNRYFFPTVYGRRELGSDVESFKTQLVSQFLGAIGRDR